MQKSNLLFLISFFFISSCGDDTTINDIKSSNTLQSSSTPDYSCNENSAVLVFFDGISQTLCGCKETPAKRTFQSYEELQCTISQNTVINFIFQSKSLKIQLAPYSNSEFPTLPQYDPNSDKPISNFGYKFETTGTFLFRNEYNNSQIGKIIVQ